MDMNIFKYAMKLEKDGEKYYRKLSKKVNDPGLKSIMTLLANDEVKHFNTFKEIADEEKRHYFLLENIIQFVSRPKTWLEDAEFNHLEEY